MARGSKRKAIEVERPKKRKEKKMSKSENKNYSNEAVKVSESALVPYPPVREIKQQYMKKFKAFMDEANNILIDGLKAHLEGMTIITSLEDGEDGYDDRDLGENVVSRHITRGVGISKLRKLGKTPMIENLEERVFKLEEAMKDIVDFVKERKLRRAEKEKLKERRR
ncbi:hypothetical protein FXO38_12462 [Capsicum annuum]|nr:hypothetical protein FXO38_12462 [Capsicum annuum]